MEQIPITIIDEQNWGHCAYEVGSLWSMVTLGATLGPSGMEEVYYVSLFNSDFQTKFQKSFSELRPAISYINSRYHGMGIKNMVQEGGCSSCSNHT